MSDTQLRNLERICSTDPTLENRQRLYDARKRAGLLVRHTSLLSSHTQLGRITTSQEWQIVESFKLTYGTHIVYMQGFASGTGDIAFRLHSESGEPEVKGIVSVVAQNHMISTNPIKVGFDVQTMELLFRSRYGREFLLDTTQITIVSNS